MDCGNRKSKRIFPASRLGRISFPSRSFFSQLSQLDTGRWVFGFERISAFCNSWRASPDVCALRLGSGRGQAVLDPPLQTVAHDTRTTTVSGNASHAERARAQHSRCAFVIVRKRLSKYRQASVRAYPPGAINGSRAPWARSARTIAAKFRACRAPEMYTRD